VIFRVYNITDIIKVLNICHLNIEDLLRKQKIESNRIEFKKGWNPDTIYHSICAFANDFDNIGGGYILVGVEEENGMA
jgi:ATP-dependent DNA helicase RecG